MKRFALEIQVNEKDALILNQSKEGLFQVQAQFTTFTTTSTDTTDDSPLFMAAVFVPDTIVESATLGVEAVEWIGRHTRKLSRQDVVSQRLLSMINPYMGHNFAIRFIISVDNHQHAPSDLVLIDLSHAPMSVVEELLNVTNGQTIFSGPDAVLKILLLSHVTFVGQNEGKRIQLPNCPVCLHRIDPARLGLPKPENQHLCSKFCQPIQQGEPCPKQSLLKPWPLPSKCVVCNVVQQYWRGDNLDEHHDLFCSECAMQETLWVCMTCGFVGCGRYSNKHAAQHFDETGHCFSLELATLRIWEYVNSEFAHRTDLLDCPTSPTVLHPWASRKQRLYSNDGYYSYGVEKSTKKTTMAGEEYEALLQSALEDQAQHFEGEIARLQSIIASDGVDLTTMDETEREEVATLKSEIDSLRVEISKSSQELLKAQEEEAKHRSNSQTLLREQQVSEGLLQKLRDEIDAEHQKGRAEIEDLEQQIHDLNANQSLRRQFTANEDLANSQIWGTSGGEERPKKGKKKRNFFRK